ncbi:SDR family NAD(P)-dependent oxidoreductase [Adhaeretor mobilis]|uniref:Putative oxidoreductase n=1 Tax=Adhaeretor mobilis TaxID=1930276 RepID=A0A517N0D7_9BACT|nr:SDR family NAD(P)-dependent oxidoreductase [Adhaeretor mobilis]QDT00498.1 putative oxidoreductase [Adhaeretor mobilis]
MSEDYWQGKACLITGGSAGLGFALAQSLARRGARLAIAARNEQHLEEAAEKLRLLGASEVIALPTDVAWQEDVDRLRDSISEEFGTLDFLCNCAGRSLRGKVLDSAAEDFQQLLDVNFLATVRVTHALAPMLLESKGHVVNVGSLASKVAPRYLGAYPASKHALAAYTQQLRLENRDAGLHAMLVCPGPIAGSNVARYEKAAEGLPAEAATAGGGAKVSAIDPAWLAEKILSACEKRRPELVVPWKAKFLLVASGISARLGDWLLGKFTPK